MITALYDGHCVICQSTRRIVTALDWRRRVEFLDLHDTATVERRYPTMAHEQMMGEIHVIEPQGRIFAGFDGTRRMLRELPLGFPLWLVLHLPGMRAVGGRVYRWIARNRYTVNRWFGVELAPTDDCLDGVCKLPQ
jgi:predicted DCC family thiol-disulfide oxidoreductase YuxK